MAPAPSSTDHLCDHCGKPIPAWAPGGNCPGCLFKKNEIPSAGISETGKREKIGDWELEEKIGEGAFGIVFAADQTHPVKRSAALKILRPGMGSKEVLARFEAESQALALLNHPDIVTIYDAGSTDDGRPFFAMEFVPGVPVTQFAGDSTINEKLSLFDRICAVVEHAHRRGIIHRDLKPANILAYADDEGKPVIKLLDFGIAKATDKILSEGTILTGEGKLLGTPEYMSPEQTSGEEVDTRTDVYSLGVILFELLVGRPPLRLDSSSLEAVLQFMNRVREETAPLPSSLSTEDIARDLDCIVGKAINKERERRYPSVGALREDLHRFQSNEPVRARPPDTLYLAGKFLRRNWKLTASLAIIALSITFAAVISSVMAVKAGVASRETSRAYSNSDLRVAVSLIDQGATTKGIAQLVRSLRTDPENLESTRLLRATLEQFPISKVTLQKDLADLNLREAFFTDPEGSFVVVTEMGTVQFHGPDGTEIAPRIEIVGTNQYAKLSHNKKLLAVTNIQGKYVLVDLVTRKPLFLKDPPPDIGQHITRVLFSPDDEKLCITSVNGIVSLWNTGDGELQWTKKLPTTALSHAFFSRGTGIALASHDGSRIDLDAETGDFTTKIPQQPEPIHSLVESGSGYRYYTVTNSGIISACDAGRAPRIFTQQRVGVPLLFSASDPVRRLSAYFSAAEANIWTVKGQTIIKNLPLPDPPTSATIHPDKNLAYIGTVESGVHLWDFERNELFGAEITRVKNAEEIQIDSTSKILRCITQDAILFHFKVPGQHSELNPSQQLPEGWDTVPLSQRNSLIVKAEAIDLQSIRDLPDQAPRSMGASQAQPLLFGAFRDGFIRVWNKESGELVDQIETTTSSVRSCDISPDGKLLAYRDRFSHFSIYDLEKKTTKRFESRHHRDISSVSFSPTGESVAIATDGGIANIFDSQTGEKISPDLIHDVKGIVSAHHCRYSPDGKTLVSWGAPDRSFRFWDTHSWKPVGIPIVGDGTPYFGMFLEDDQLFAVISEDQNREYTLRVWSIPENSPVTPKRKISMDSFDASLLRIPESKRFTNSELEAIESACGLHLGPHGFTESFNR